MLNYNDVERNAELASVQFGYMPGGFYARELLPVIEVTKPSGKYAKFDAAHMRHIKSASEGSAAAPQVDIGLSWANYHCEEHPRSAFVPDLISREIGNAAALPVMQMIQVSLLIEEERALAAAMNTTGNFTNSNYVTPTTLWDAAGADPFAGAYGVKAGLTYLYGVNGNRRKDVVMFVTPDVDLVLSDFARASIGNSGYDLPDEAAMARYFRVREYVVLDSAYNSAVPGQTDSLAGCWGTKQCWLVNVPTERNLLVPSFGKTILDTAGSTVDQEVLKDPKGDKLIARNSYDQETISYNLAYWIKDCIS